MRPWILPVVLTVAVGGSYWLGRIHADSGLAAERASLASQRASQADLLAKERARLGSPNQTRIVLKERETDSDSEASAEARDTSRRGHLSNERLAALIPEVLGEQDPVERGRRLANLLDNLTPENMSVYLKAFDEGPGLYRDHEKRMLMFALGKVDGPQAMTLIAQDGDERKFRDLGNSILSGWASQNPEQAAKWQMSLTDERAKSDFINGLVDGWGKKDLAGACAYVANLSDFKDRNRAADNLARLLIMNGGMVAAAAWATSIPGGKENDTFRHEAFAAVMREGMTVDPAAALAVLKNNMGQPFAADLYREMAGRATERNPKLGQEFAESQTDPEVRSRSFEAVVDRLARNDANTAGSWLNQYPDDPNLDRARRTFARQVYDQNPEAALAWVDAIKQPAIRERTAVEMAREWMRKEPEKARAWVQSSKLPDSVKLTFQPKR